MIRRRTRWLAMLALLGCLPAASAQAASTDPLVGIARLQGSFLLAGRVTAARGIRGEHRGQAIARLWGFVPACPVGACPTIILFRRRPGGLDSLILRRRSPGLYAGNGSFFAPLRCGRRTLAHGEAVPFTITVHVTAAAATAGTAIATRVSATMISARRRNLTSCVAAPAHEAAAYHGHLVVTV